MDEMIFRTHAVRRLYKPDLPTLRDHLLRLDPETRHDRFGLYVSDAYLKDYAANCFESGTIVYAYVENGVVRGAGELRMYVANAAGGAKEAEAAFSVERAWRRRGIGFELMSHILLACRNRFVSSLSIFCLRHNQAMLNLARKFEADIEFELNEATGRLVARSPSALSLWQELVDETLDLGTAALDYQSRLFKAAVRPSPAPGRR